MSNILKEIGTVFTGIIPGIKNWKSTLIGLLGALHFSLESGDIAFNDLTNPMVWLSLLLVYVRDADKSTEESR